MTAPPPAHDPLHLDNAAFSQLLDLLRWVAALLVVLQHARWRGFVPFAEVENRGAAQALFYFISGWGHEAVVVFFVLSGYLVGGRAWQAARQGRFRPGVYAIDRVSRLYVVAIPAILLGIGFDALAGALGYRMFHPPIVFAQAGAPVLLCNFAMLQSLVCPVAGSNAPLWSLAYEFWFYVVGGLACLAVGLRAAPRTLAVIAVLGVCALLGPGFLFGLMLWLVGVLAAVRPARAGRALLIGAGMLLAVGLAFGRAHKAMDFSWRDLPLCAGLALLLYCLKARSLWFPKRLENLNRALANFSYTLYAVHMPVLLLLLSLAFPGAEGTGAALGLQPTAANVLIFATVLAGVVGVAFLLSLVSERQTRRVRLAAYRWFLKQPRGSPREQAA
ncbi:MAG TPA: acyltransferase [Solimonas sp.]|nr:acyltransferase [Solimonas sp.]